MEENPRFVTSLLAMALSPFAMAMMLPALLLASAMTYVGAIVYLAQALTEWSLRPRLACAHGPFQDPHFRAAILNKVRRE